MRYLNAILFLIFVTTFSFAQKADTYSEKFGKLIITLPSKPDTLILGESKSLMSKTAKGSLIITCADVSQRLDDLPSKHGLKKFYIEEIDWIYTQNVRPDEIKFFKIGTHDAAYFPVTDQTFGTGYGLIVVIDKEYYTALYAIPVFNKKELEYTIEEFIELFKLNNAAVKNEK